MSSVTDLLLPHCCRLCRAETAPIDGLCPDCWRGLSRIANGCWLCGAPIAGHIVPTCKTCYQQGRSWDYGYAVARYRGVARDMVLKFKHGGDEGLARVMAQLMHARHGHALAGVDRIMAMPLHWRRRMGRGFNQSAKIAGHLARLFESPYSNAGLRRIRHTKPQDRDFNAADRLANVDGAFAYDGVSIRGQRLLIVDDVMTSGASLHHLCAVLAHGQPRSLEIIVFARAPQKH